MSITQPNHDNNANKRIMNSLLKRQIIKYLPKNLQSNKELDGFLDAIERSYTTSDEQFLMLQRATKISSEELFEANKKLEEETNSQRKIIVKLKSVMDTLKFYELEQDNPLENSGSLKLVDFIDNQTKEILKINQQKDILLKDLERQNLELNEYAHMIFHDLKSPLQSVEALTVWLKEDYDAVLDDEGKEIIIQIRQQVEKIDTIVKAISTYANIETIENKKLDIDIDFILSNFISDVKNSNNLEILIPRKLPIIQGSLRNLEQLFKNLLSNAIKFNDKENKKIEIGFTEQNNFWQFYIKDNGKGIEEKYFDKIFTAFFKLNNDYESVGIGLSIVKKIVEAYSGEIKLESKVNVGTTFYLTLKK